MSDACCSDLDVSNLAARQRRVLIIVLFINIAAFLIMVGGAWLSGSVSLLSGTLDNFGDAVTYALSLAVVGAGCSAKARVALFKGLLILGAAVAVAVQIMLQLSDPQTPLFTTMGLAAVANLGANLLCLWLLTPYRHDDINMSSVWECSRNDVAEGCAVIGAAAAVWIFSSPWPDLLVAIALLVMFTRSAWRVLTGAWRELYPSSQSV
ncbi:MAG: cation transporter [Pseudomonadaceae bacterium]|nr:cation transporter [Pseudomonadaceae bacterium]